MFRFSTLVAVAGACLWLAGCSTELFGGEKIDYRAEAVKTRPLDVPPDLTQLARDSRYQPIGAGGGSVSAAAAASAAAATSAAATSATAVSASAPATGATAATNLGTAPAAATAVTAATVAANQFDSMRIERAGQQRWLVVQQQTPEQLWPKLKAFWEKTGFVLALDNPQAGVMETTWSENRAKLPNDVVRNVLGSLARNLYDTGERDLYRTRLERLGDGGVEVYISHRGVEEVIGGPLRDQATWRARPSDPDLEAEMLARLMLALGSSTTSAAAIEASPRPAASAVTAAIATVNAAPQGAARARNTGSSERASMEIDEAFDRAWRRVGLVLDRGGFTVEDRDRTAGIYYVRYSDPKAAGQDEPNWFQRTFGGTKDPATPVRYRIVLKGSGAKTNVDVLTSDGGTATGENGQRIVARLLEDLK
jgi:outer membrane protein assembly factor BamC